MRLDRRPELSGGLVDSDNGIGVTGPAVADREETGHERQDQDKQRQAFSRRVPPSVRILSNDRRRYQ